MEVFNPPRAKPRPIRQLNRRFFSVEHANRALPLVRRIVTDMVRQYKRVGALEERCHIRRPSVSAEKQERLRRQYHAALQKLRELSQELEAVGCLMKDYRRGLVDFPSMRDGREIELCWRLGEDAVAHWHERGAGFGARQPIADELVSSSMDTSSDA